MNLQKNKWVHRKLLVKPVSDTPEHAATVCAVLARVQQKDVQLQQWVEDHAAWWAYGVVECQCRLDNGRASWSLCSPHGRHANSVTPCASVVSNFVRADLDCRRRSARHAPMLTHLYRNMEILHWAIQRQDGLEGCGLWECTTQYDGFVWMLTPFVVWCLQVAESGSGFQQSMALVSRAALKFRHFPEGERMLKWLCAVAHRVRELGWWTLTRSTE